MKKQVLILVVMALICGLYSTSHADIEAITSIRPGDNDTSLIVEFRWSYFKDASGSESKTFTFKWREKGVSEEWESSTKLCLHFSSGYEYCCEIDESKIPNT